MGNPKPTYKELENRIKQLELDLKSIYNGSPSKDLETRRMLEENEEYFRTMIEQSPIGIQIYNLDGFGISANQAWADIWGIEDVNSVLNKFNVLTDPQIAKLGLTKYFKKAFAGEHVDIAEVRFEPDISGFPGRLRYVKIRSYPLKKSDGSFNKIVVLNEDITESKISEQKMKELNDKLAVQNKEYHTLNKELIESVERIQIINTELKEAKEKAQESEVFTKMLFNTSPIGLALAKLGGELMDINIAYANIIGYSIDETLKLSYWDITPEKYAQQEQKQLDSLEKNGTYGPYEKEYIHKSGKLISVRLQGKIIELDGNKFIWSSVENISEKKESEQLLKNQNKELKDAKNKAEQSEEQLKLIANNFVNGMIYQVAMLDEDRRQFNYVSDAVYQLYGCTADEAKENPNLIYGKIYKEDIDGLIQKEKEALKEMSIFKTEARVINPDGSIRWSYYISRPRIINGLVCWDGIEIDITEQKKIEQELKDAKAKAVESDKLKSAFLANMSHEIRTPMNSILGFSDLLREDDLSDEKKEKYLEQISSGGNRLLTIISDIVDVSKIDANQLSLSYGVCDINKIIDNLYNQFSISDINTNVSLKIQKSLSDSQSVIKTDNIRLIQILSNLIENALKFTKKGEVEFGYILKKNLLLFFVKDNGIGIDTKYHELVFDRFRQVDNDYFGSKAGTGLGLSIVKGLVELLGGEIWVESEKDKGATFYFTIPYDVTEHSSEDEDIIKEVIKPDKNSEVTILIAEDELSNFMYLEELLEVYEYKIIHAINGKKAVELVNEDSSIDLILMDIKMPKMNGFEATKEIRKINKSIPIIAQTAYAMAEDRAKAINAGCNDYLAKPISSRLLAQVLKKQLKK